MDLYVFLVLTLIFLSPTFASCPDTCSCLKDETFIPVTLKVYDCDDLKYLPLDLITSDVTKLLIENNNIRVLSNIDDNVTNATQVEILDLSNNRISKIEVHSLRVFNSLEQLYLDKNNISNIPNELFNTIPKLNHLSLYQNPNLVLPANGFDTKELVYLNLAQCNLKVIPLKFFDSMPNLKFLFLLHNHISNLDSNLILHFKRMQVVDLQHNKFTMFQPGLVTLITEHKVDLLLQDNPFQCNCQFKDELELYEAKNVISNEFRFLYDPLYELQCVVPPESYNNNGSLNQEEFLKSLDCDVSKNKIDSVATNTSTSVVYSDVNTNITSYDTSNESTKPNNNELDNGDSLTANVDMHNNVLSTNHTALWVVLGIVVVSVLLVVIVVIVRRQRRETMPINIEILSQLGLLPNEVENVE